MSGWNNGIDDHLAAHRMINGSGFGQKSKSRPLIDMDLLAKNLDRINPRMTQPETQKAQALPLQPPAQQVDVEQESIDLSKLIDQLKSIQAEEQKLKENQAGQIRSQAELVYSQRTTVTMSLVINKPGTIDGLVVRDRNTVETDRYQFNFNDNGQELTIVDKWSRHSTRIWGDPHVDLDDMEGDRNGEFTDLKESNTHTTFMLMDGTRVTIRARDDGVIEAVDIIKNNQRVHGLGFGAPDRQEQPDLFSAQVLWDGITAGGSTPRGDTVFARGDGSDWFNAAGKLVWGHASAPAAVKPSQVSLEIKYKQTIEQKITVSQVEKSI
jgi:hypothetical protein